MDKRFHLSSGVCSSIVGSIFVYMIKIFCLSCAWEERWAIGKKQGSWLILYVGVLLSSTGFRYFFSLSNNQHGKLDISSMFMLVVLHGENLLDWEPRISNSQSFFYVWTQLSCNLFLIDRGELDLVVGFLVSSMRIHIDDCCLPKCIIATKWKHVNTNKDQCLYVPVDCSPTMVNLDEIGIDPESFCSLQRRRGWYIYFYMLFS